MIRQNNDQKYQEKVPVQIGNGSVDKCDVINKDYIFQGTTMKIYQCNILQATESLSAHIQNGTHTHSDSEYDKVLTLTYFASQQDCLRFNATLYGYWNSQRLC